MIKNKKAPGRPKKEFVSKKPKTKIKSWPGRPRKDQNSYAVKNTVPSEVVGFVAKSVDESKKKDLIILVLFLLSFILFVVSLYFTFMRDKKLEGLSQSEISEIANIQTGNIDYASEDSALQEAKIDEEIDTQETVAPIVQPSLQDLSLEQQTIVDFYQAINAIDTTTIYKLTDARLEESNIFKTYYTKNRLSRFLDTIIAPKIMITNIQEKPTTSTNPNIKNFSYTIEYTLAKNQQKFTEERSTTLIKKWDNRRIGKLMCETKWCSMMPFFNTDKYK